MPIWLIITATSLYIATLFAIAWRVDRQAPASGPTSGIIYALGLTVYCTSWTFYGAVGTAVSSQWDYLWILLGPAIVFALMPGIHRRLADIGQREGVSSLSDFLSARYGKSAGLAALAALAATAGSLPYIALQLKSVGTSLSILAERQTSSGTEDSVFAIAIAMALFAILFGARGTDVTRRNPGLIRVLAIEALVKLMALGAVALFAISLLQDHSETVQTLSAAHFSEFRPTGRSFIILLISMTAILCLPRQFHVTVVERHEASDTDWARWLFPIYLLVIAALVIPISVAGMALLPDGTPADTFVLSLPLSENAPLLGLLVFLGGISAATGMVIVASVTLSTMVTNDIVVPLLLRDRRARFAQLTGRGLILIRRAVIMLLMLMAYGYFRAAGDGPALAQIGLLSFAAAAQFAPLLIGALYWRRANRVGAIAGLCTGMIVWAYTLFIPGLVGVEVLRETLPLTLDPHALFGTSLGDSLTHGVIWSLSLNSLAYGLGSIYGRERLRDKVQATAFSRTLTPTVHSGDFFQSSVGKHLGDDDLRSLAARFLDPQAVDHAFSEFRKEAPEGGWERIRQTERLLSRAIGASSARIIMSSALSGSEVRFDDVLRIFDQKSARRMFDDHGVQALMESLGEGISVVDNEQRLIAWNGQYIDLFDYPDNLLKAGTPIRDLIQHNIENGWIRGTNPDEIADRRVMAMREGRPHLYERQNPDGRYLRIEGHPLPGGGYITTFRDITEDRLREEELREINETLELRVMERTRDLQQLSEDLEAAKKEADAANLSKTRFLAAASHDLLQPLNAARLFLASTRADSQDRLAVSKAEKAIQSADELLKGLLDLSRLDQSSSSAQISAFPLAPMLEDLVEEALPMAQEAGLTIRFVPTSLAVATDPAFLQSILRNYLSNARRYTLDGGVLIGARRERDMVRIEVWDTGPGLADSQQTRIFEEFARGSDVDNRGVRGAGLGLSVVRRLANLMGAKLDMKSRLGHGSVFSVTVPRASAFSSQSLPNIETPIPERSSLSGLSILCLDDDLANLDALDSLLSCWGCHVQTSSNFEEAKRTLARHHEAILIADYDLGTEHTGLDLIETRLTHTPSARRNILLTASQDKHLQARCQEIGIQYLQKPADPDQLRTALEEASHQDR